MLRSVLRCGAPIIFLLAAAYVLAGCSFIPDYQRPAVPTQPAWATPADATAIPVSAAWWRHFGSPELDKLM